MDEDSVVALDWDGYFSTGDIFNFSSEVDKAVLFHGTTYKNYETIIRDGLIPSQDPIEMTKEIVELYRDCGADRMTREISSRYGIYSSYVNLASWKDANYGKNGKTSVYFSETPGRALTYADKNFTGGEMRTSARGCLDLLEKLGESGDYEDYRKSLINRYWRSTKRRIPELVEILERESFKTNFDEIDFVQYNELLETISRSAEIKIEPSKLGLYDAPISNDQLLERVKILKKRYSQIYEGLDESKHGLLIAVEFEDEDLQYFRTDLGGMNHGLAFCKPIPPNKIVGYRKVLETSWEKNYAKWLEVKNSEQFVKMARERDDKDIVGKLILYKSNNTNKE